MGSLKRKVLKTYRLTCLESSNFLFFLMNNHRQLVDLIELHLSFEGFDLVVIELLPKDDVPTRLHKNIIKEFDTVMDASVAYSRGEF